MEQEVAVIAPLFKGGGGKFTKFTRKGNEFPNNDAIIPVLIHGKNCGKSHLN